jgi:hypothetical protein
MRWMIGAVAVLVLVGVAAWSVLVPPTSGLGWRLDPDAQWGHPLLADNFSPSVVIYVADESTIGFGVTVYGSSSCPPRLRGVEIDGGNIEVRASRDIAWIFTGCTADAAAHSFGILVARDRLATPLTVDVHSDDLPSSQTIFEELP